MTLKDGYGFGGFSGTPLSEPTLSTPPPPPGVLQYFTKIALHGVYGTALRECVTTARI